MNPVWVISPVVGLLGLAAGYYARHVAGKLSADASEQKAATTLKDAKREAEAILKDAGIQAKAEVLKARDEFEATTKAKREKIAALEEKIDERERNLDRKVSMIDKKEHTLEERMSDLDEKSKAVDKKGEELERLITSEKDKLQSIAGMTQQQARDALLERIEKEIKAETGGLIRRLHEEARDTAEQHAREIVATAIQRYSSSHAADLMTSTVMLPSDDMKGRIIGREGRNIRAIEGATGVNLLIDDTPEAVVISGFDPIRREVARLALEDLIADGRIHPARIEEVVKKVEENMEDNIRTAGREAAYEAGVDGVSPELLKMLGRLKYRTSYSQNVLRHSLEVSHLMGVMAGELDLDVSLAKRIGLFHDIGKALDREVEGGHALIGADLLRKHGENPVVINAVAAHHEDVESESVYAILAEAADTISGSRPGARSETTEIYLKRLEKLEGVANSFQGVAKSYAIHAGREVRVLVQPEEIDDNSSRVLARDIVNKIEHDLQYPGKIRVTVIRETRCVEYAK